MIDLEKCGFATKQIHAGKHENAAGALTPPIYQTSTFEFACSDPADLPDLHL